MKHQIYIALFSALLLSTTSQAQMHESMHLGHNHEAHPMGEHTMMMGEATGVIRRINLRDGKITIKHQPLEGLNMPAMTMEFSVDSTESIADLKRGDSVKFTTNSAMQIQHIEKY